MVVSRTSDGGTVYFTSDEDAFAPTLEEAVQFGKNNFMLDNLPNTIIEVRVPNSIMQNVYRFGADGMNAISIPTEYLPSSMMRKRCVSEQLFYVFSLSDNFII